MGCSQTILAERLLACISMHSYQLTKDQKENLLDALLLYLKGHAKVKIQIRKNSAPKNLGQHQSIDYSLQGQKPAVSSAQHVQETDVYSESSHLWHH